MKTLRDAKIGETVKVVKLHGEGAVKRRIMDMGLTKGVEVYIPTEIGNERIAYYGASQFDTFHSQPIGKASRADNLYTVIKK